MACMLRILGKPDLGGWVVLDEFCLVMENFGVPREEDQESCSEEDYVPDCETKRGYCLENIATEGLNILRITARHLLKEYVHPRDFFGKMIKAKQEVNTATRTFKVDLLSVKDFYLKIKIANVRKVLTENESLNRELCLD